VFASSTRAVLAQPTNCLCLSRFLSLSLLLYFTRLLQLAINQADNNNNNNELLLRGSAPLSLGGRAPRWPLPPASAPPLSVGRSEASSFNYLFFTYAMDAPIAALLLAPRPAHPQNSN